MKNPVKSRTSFEGYFRIHTYFKIIDCIIFNIKKRFFVDNLEITESIDNFFLLKFEKKKKLFKENYKV